METDASFVQQALMTNRGYTGHEQVDELDLMNILKIKDTIVHLMTGYSFGA
ncbi:hypothetical protein KDD30_05670 [Photobacterium sp. GJ3]|uniref:hypothetical protein n=1 Tax=Photobacterium sp. GJ3 TaxID=2829502 RepID=UPI001B8CB7B6|nr:hypothetical protein [Photobacterium sp. GJ3]QUJ68600.1 hypothetical protein KDD30_05670 [Photobacterium sp. GJ3]